MGTTIPMVIFGHEGRVIKHIEQAEAAILCSACNVGGNLVALAESADSRLTY